MIDLSQALVTFGIESRELLDEMEQGLLLCERGDADADTLNAIFRAAHTIKGSAGLFGFTAVVEFTHEAETLLDRVRAGEQALSPDLISVLLDSADHLRVLVEKTAAETALSTDEQQHGAAIHARLQQLCDQIGGLTNVDSTTVASAAAHPSVAQYESGEAAATDCWHVSVRFGVQTFINGFDPVSFIRYLGTLGQLQAIQLVQALIPLLPELDAEQCYLGFEISLLTSADRARIEAAFDFVKDDCQLRIIAPKSAISEYIDLIRTLPETPQRIGEMLVSVGTLTRQELDAALSVQHAERASGEPVRPIGEILVANAGLAEAVLREGLKKQSKSVVAEGAGGNTDRQLLRVDAAKLDELINLIGELIIAGDAVHHISRRHGFTELNESASRVARLVSEVRDHALGLRMVQIGATFARFSRVVRDVSRELGKDIRLEIAGEETELDKTLIERITDPLTHLVRNSMDHGIESESVRQQRGKPAAGVIGLNAYHESGSVIIEVSDDGGGLDRDRIVARAVERGLIEADAQLTDQQIYALIFEPGFSTKDQVTALSGRGVGMDVVKRNVESLRGSIEIHSEIGQGTCIQIRLPLTLAIIEGFMVRAGRSFYIVPMDVVEECVEYAPETSGLDDPGHMVSLRGNLLPFIDLRRVFDCEGALSVRRSIVVARFGQRRFGLLVDDLLGEQQAVIKPLAGLLQNLECVSGSTILGNGGIALILDVPSLVRRAELMHLPSFSRPVAIAGLNHLSG